MTSKPDTSAMHNGGRHPDGVGSSYGSYIGKCLRGQIAVSGGYEIIDLYNEAAVPDVIVSKAALVFDADGKPRSYEVRAKNPTDRLLNVYSRVHCVPE
ncbi:hypothetical protein ACIBK9_18470 [Nonomuraea sp. NPDC050227]|uniref:hypothetical protein n=1 Tax=Nonomuraea sp. NPDC050227 TaxID=3364360 RepID=UPI00379B10D1